MEDREIKKLLLETCPVRPGQESRAWAALREQLYVAKPAPIWSGIFAPNWRGAAAVAGVLLLISTMGSFLLSERSAAMATADSQAPGIYATAFYSHAAEAQVVWLNGLEPASDKPTYLDPTSAMTEKTSAPRDPNSL